jgi:hypothetical protein
MNNSLQNPAFSLKEWMVPPVLVPLALIVLLVIWVMARPHLG